MTSGKVKADHTRIEEEASGAVKAAGTRPGHA